MSAKQFDRRGLAAAVAVLGLAGIAGAQTTTLFSGHPESSGGFGTEVASVPDTNGDGVPDIVVGAFAQKVGTINSAGRVTVHSGTNGAILRVIVSPHKEDSGWFGGAVSGVPDANGDGRGDILVGAYNEGNTGAVDGFGRAYLFNGATGTLLRILLSPNQEASGNFGRSVAGLSDVTGDSRGDLAVGAFREDPGASPSDAGRAYIYNGATGALFKSIASPNQTTAGYFGVSMDAVPDVTGDNRPELVIGATGESPGGTVSAGRVYIFNGVTGLLNKSFTSANPEAFGQFGASVGGVRDTNGDARGEIIVGAPFEDQAGLVGSGRAYLFSGLTGVRLRTFAVGMPEAGDLFGSSVAGLSDMNNDGRGDVAIGAAHADPGGSPSDSGRAYIYSGATGVYLRGLAPPAPEAGGSFGTSITGVPDVNNNGKGDVVVGAPFNDTPNIDDVGRAYLFRN